jgi:hypothetical protein
VALSLAAAVLVTGAPTASASYDPDREFLQMLNYERVGRGMQPLKRDEVLIPIAREWSGAMAASNTLSHRPDLRAQVDNRVTRAWTRIGENVGRGGSVRSLHEAFMASPSHRDNVLGDFNRVAIGTVGSGPTIWVTFNFVKGPDINGVTGLEPQPVAAPPPPPPPAPAPPAPVHAAVATRGIQAACPANRTPGTAFADLGGSAHASSIGCVSWWGVANGRSNRAFDPSGAVTRGQLASFVSRMIASSGRALPSSPPNAFADDAGSVHERAIDQLAAMGVVAGRSPGRFGPDEVVGRAAMATFLVRAHDVVSATPLPAGTDSFGDDDGNSHEANVNKVAAAGLAGGTSPGVYAPGAGVQRGQMASFLARSLDLLVASGTTPRR